MLGRQVHNAAALRRCLVGAVAAIVCGLTACAPPDDVNDAGTPPQDGGAPTVDGGVPFVDAGPLPLDPLGDEDDDGYANGLEERFGADPRDPGSLPPDVDGDRIVDPDDTDVDGDGYDNDVERRLGADPRDAASRPRDGDSDGSPDADDADDDNDGVEDGADAFPDDATEQLDTDDDGVGDATDLDDDDDGWTDVDEAAAGSDPRDDRARPDDLDGDGVADAGDDDDDGDGVADAADAFPRDPAEQTDLDGDGAGDGRDPDDDGDGWADTVELAAGTDQRAASSRPTDLDGDGVDDGRDGDDDGDGVGDPADVFPRDPAETTDLDGDGTGDNADVDDDADGYPDAVELRLGTNPRLATSRPIDLDGDGLPDADDADVDGDGAPNAIDAFAFDPAEQKDTDGDGTGDNRDTDDDGDRWPDTVETGFGADPLDRRSTPPDLDGDFILDGDDPDRDGDGEANATDALPDDPRETRDFDVDGIGDNADVDDDDDGYADLVEESYGSDPFDDASTPPDQDGDGLADADDPDRDGDGYDVLVDLFPFDPSEHDDTDRDGTGDNADLDDDGDGFADALEAGEGSDPLDERSTPGDIDGDRVPDSSDPDVDGDGTENAVDAFPRDRTETADADGDGQGDNGDPDDDNDRYVDVVERAAGSDPFDAASVPADLDGDLNPDATDPDIDGDGASNLLDALPRDPTETADTDRDGTGNNADLDDDGDRYADVLEVQFGSDPLRAASTPPDLDGDLVPDALDDDRDGDGVLNLGDAFPDDPTKFEEVVAIDSFAGGYQALIPPDAEPDAFVDERASIARGRVFESGTTNPRADVIVSVIDHPEFGTTSTDASGNWSIVLNGGGTFTFRFDDVGGGPTVDRNITVPWNDIVVAPDIEVTPPDPVATTDVLDGNAADAIVHQNVGFAAPLTVVIPKDVTAIGVKADGSREPLSEVTVRATEYETEEGMPASLPPSSAFTLCVEFTVDGYDQVEFSSPVTVWVPNFLDFDVGDLVPFGYYDRELAAWTPLPDGVIVRLLDTDGDSIVDAVDDDGDGAPDDVSGDGTFTDEVFGIDATAGFVPGAEFWRLLTDHFSPLDPNYPTAPCAACGPPPGCTGNNCTDPRLGPGADDPNSNPDKGNCTKGGTSRVSERARTLHQDIPLPGTAVTLHYNSEWADGFQIPVEFPLSGPSVPAELKSITARYGIAGREESTTRPPLPNQRASLLWDGRDFLGRPVRGQTIAWADVSFAYRPTYYTSRAEAAAVAASFAGTGTRISGTFTRGDITVSRRFEFPVIRTQQWGNGVRSRLGAGWAIGGYFSYDHASRQVVDGSGLRIDATDLGRVVNTRNRTTLLSAPDAVVTDAAGDLFYVPQSTEADANTIYRVDGKTGAVTVRHRAASAIADLAADPRGGLVFSEGPLVRRLAVDATTSRAVANLFFEYQECFAKEGSACRIEVAVDPGGYIRAVPRYVGATSTGNHLSLISPDGAVVRFPLNFYCVVGDLAIHPDGSTLVSCATGPVRRIEPNSTIVTLPGFSPDCGTPASYSGGAGMAVAADGGIFLADNRCHRVSKIDPAFGSNVFFGRGTAGNSGDGGPLLDAELRDPRGVALSPDGTLVVADSGNRALRGVQKQQGAVDVPDGETFIPLEDGLVLVFSDTHILKAVRNLATGRDIRNFRYDASLRLVAIDELDGRSTTFVHDDADRIVAVVGPFGDRSDVRYDAAGRVEAIEREDGASFGFAYDFRDLMVRKTTPDGDVSSYSFDAAGRIRETARGGTTSTFARSDAEGAVGRTFTVTDGGGQSTLVDSFDANGNRTTTYTGLDGQPYVTTEGADKQVERVTAPDGASVELRNGIDPRDRAEFIARAVQTTPLGVSLTLDESRTFDPTTKVWTSVKRESGVVVERTVEDPTARTRVTTDREGPQLRITLDANSDRPVRLEPSGLTPTTLSYRADGLLTSTTQGDRTVRVEYGARGRPSAVQLPDGGRVGYSYDAIGRITAVETPDGALTRMAYTGGSSDHPQGKVREITRDDGRRVLFDFDARERLRRITRTDGANVEMVYGADDRLAEMRLPGGVARRMAYANGRVVGAEFVGATGLRPLQINYDVAGRPSRITSATGVGREFRYDGPLRTATHWTGHPALSVTSTWEASFRMRERGIAGERQALRYDAAGRLLGVGDLTIGRDPVTARINSYGVGGTTWSWISDGFGELTSASMVAGARAYTYDLERTRVGHIVSIDELEPRGALRTRAFELDAMGRPTVVREDGEVVEAYTWDAAGNRTSATNKAMGWSGEPWTYDDADRVLATPDATFTYDGAGHRATRVAAAGTTLYRHSDGHLLSVRLPDGREVGYRYDDRGWLAERLEAGAVTHRYVYDETGELLVVADGNDVVRERYEWGNGRPLRLRKDGVTYALATDPVGSIRAVVRADGVVVQEIRYDTMGNRVDVLDPTFEIALDYALGIRDRATGLVRMGARSYDPATGVFLQVDPLGYDGGLNLYAYAAGRAHQDNDPLGFAPNFANTLAGLQLQGALVLGAARANPKGAATAIASSVVTAAGNAGTFNSLTFGVGGSAGVEPTGAVKAASTTLDWGGAIAGAVDVSSNAAKVGGIGGLGVKVFDAWSADWRAQNAGTTLERVATGALVGGEFVASTAALMASGAALSLAITAGAPVLLPALAVTAGVLGVIGSAAKLSAYLQSLRRCR
jgi:RHS repeat-associated protein